MKYGGGREGGNLSREEGWKGVTSKAGCSIRTCCNSSATQILTGTQIHTCHTQIHTGHAQIHTYAHTDTNLLQLFTHTQTHMFTQTYTHWYPNGASNRNTKGPLQYNKCRIILKATPDRQWCPIGINN